MDLDRLTCVQWYCMVYQDATVEFLIFDVWCFVSLLHKKYGVMANQSEVTPFFPRVIAALPTPCKEAGVVDPEGMTRLSQEVSRRGCDGLFVLGSTGEMVLIDEDDRRPLTVAARTGGGDNIQVLVGIGGFGAKQAIRYARMAADDQADVAVAMAPFFQVLGQSELIEHFERIADKSPIPIGIYHHLRMTTSFTVETIAQLSRHPNIVAYKDTSADPKRLQEIINATAGTAFHIYQGNEPLLLESMNGGAYGCVSALATISPEWHRELIDAAVRGDLALAEHYQKQLNRLVALFRISGVRTSLSHFVHTLKVGAVHQGWLTSAASLLPGFQPTVEFEDAIQKVLNEVLVEPLEIR